MDRDRYRSLARVSGGSPKLRRPHPALDAAVLGLALVFILMASPRIAGALSAGAEDFEGRLGALFPTLPGSKPIDLPSGGGTVSGDIAAQSIPDFTREPSLPVAGKLPEFAQGSDRTIEITLNGALVATLTPDTTGAFSATLDLKEGPNAIALALMAGNDVAARASYTVVLDRQVPTLAVTKPGPNASVEAPNVVVEGKGEAGVTITIDGRTVIAAPDGTFSDTFTATPGARTITVVARDRAGNETTVKTGITVKAAPNTGPLSVSVTLDRSRVTPGAQVLARIEVTANGLPKADEQVTLSVGVITIGSAKTNAAGIAFIGFAAPPNEGDASVIVLATGASGRAALTVAR
ncbi:MAG TPA: hypothetical protein VM052_00190 [Candidatus Limnocylindrales bacterium]|nr:hypothetical protein [Candidatus Limnocylindrales bacterium]